MRTSPTRKDFRNWRKRYRKVCSTHVNLFRTSGSPAIQQQKFQTREDARYNGCVARGTRQSTEYIGWNQRGSLPLSSSKLGAESGAMQEQLWRQSENRDNCNARAYAARHKTIEITTLLPSSKNESPNSRKSFITVSKHDARFSTEMLHVEYILFN